MNSKVNIETTKDKEYKQVSLLAVDENIGGMPQNIKIELHTQIYKDDKNIAHLCFVGKDSSMGESVQFDVDVSKKDIKKFIKKLKKLIGAKNEQ